MILNVNLPLKALDLNTGHYMVSLQCAVIEKSKPVTFDMLCKMNGLEKQGL